MGGKGRDNGGRWWLGLLIGLLVGAGVALLLAPYSGQRLRSRFLGGADRVRDELRGTERFGGGPDADPIARLKQRFDEAINEARRAYDMRRAELVAELERDREIKLLAASRDESSS